MAAVASQPTAEALSTRHQKLLAGKPTLAESGVSAGRLRRMADAYLRRDFIEHILVHLTPAQQLVLMWLQSFNGEAGCEDTEAKLGERLKLDEREVRDSLLAFSACGAIDMEDLGRGRGFRAKTRPDQFHQLRVWREKRVCRPRADKEPAPETKPVPTIPVTLSCPAGVAQCPVTELVQLPDGQLSNIKVGTPVPASRCSGVGTPVPTSPPESSPAHAAPAANFGGESNVSPPLSSEPAVNAADPPASSAAVDELRKWFLSEVPPRVSMPDEDFLAGVVRQLSDTPVAYLTAAVAQPRAWRKFSTAGYVLSFVAEARRNFQRDEQRRVAETQAQSSDPAAEARLQASYDQYREDVVRVYMRTLLPRESEQLYAEAGKLARKLVPQLDRLPKSTQAEVIDGSARKLAADLVEILSFDQFCAQALERGALDRGE
jgi:hypothetical protein